MSKKYRVLVCIACFLISSLVLTACAASQTNTAVQAPPEVVFDDTNIDEQRSGNIDEGDWGDLEPVEIYSKDNVKCIEHGRMYYVFDYNRDMLTVSDIMKHGGINVEGNMVFANSKDCEFPTVAFYNHAGDEVVFHGVDAPDDYYIDGALYILGF